MWYLPIKYTIIIPVLYNNVKGKNKKNLIINHANLYNTGAFTNHANLYKSGVMPMTATVCHYASGMAHPTTCCGVKAKLPTASNVQKTHKKSHVIFTSHG